MRLQLKLYIVLVATAAGSLLAHDLSVLTFWPHAWSLGVTIALIVLTVVGDHLQFEVRRGWYTNASAVAHVAAAFLLPPGLAMLTAGIAAGLRVFRYPLPPAKAAFNIASISLAVGLAAHLATHLGGPDRVSPGGTWTDPLVAVLVSATYCALSSTMVTVAISIDQRRVIWQVTRGNLGIQMMGEIGLGLVGAMLAAMLNSAPNWAPTLLVPAGLLYIAKQSMDRADRRSRNMAVTSAVGRAVVGTLDPERAFQAIAETAVLDGLKLDGLALLPIGTPAAFHQHVATDADRPSLRDALVAQLALQPRQMDLRTGIGRQNPHWLPADVRGAQLAVAAIPFGAGAGRPVGGLIAWRELHAGRQPYFDHDEMLVLKTLADYAAVTLETARLGQETARLHHEAGQAEALREMESLREVARLKDEFLGQVSHELRTPLTIIHGYSELMVDGLLKEEELIRSSANEIHTSSALMLRLVDDLLDTSRLDSGRIELQRDSVELASWLARVANSFGQATPSHSVVADLPTRLPLVSADVDRLGQVMNNLLSNAARYSTEGSLIRVSAFADFDQVEVRVIDQGPGIAVEDCERIFEKFYRGRHGATLAVRGTGLGLAVARQLVEAHGGQIGVRTTPGHGSTFWVRLPLANPAPTPPIAVAPLKALGEIPPLAARSTAAARAAARIR
ncbi:MAG TPA: ATP-binding protein [Chloroflexota bacterium]|jgi:signal transduction histidine kinase|nr:ATP-binding protein [Chloroflexota bacterium]